MGLFDNIFNNDSSVKEPDVPRHEHFPADKYGPAYPVAVYQEDLRALRELVEAESSAPTAVEQSVLLDEVMDDRLRVRKSGEDISPFINDLIETWGSQMEADPSAVWWPVASDWQLQMYLQYCELRNDREEDAFEFPTSIGRVHSLFTRCKAAQENDAKLALVHKDEIPGEEPVDEE